MTTQASPVAAAPPTTAPANPGVPWLTVVWLAAVLAYADGFWALSLRGATGAVERTDSPFVSWLRESTLLLPWYALAVLGAVALAYRWFGPRVHRARPVLAAAALIAAAGTVAGVIHLAASSVADYQLQSALVARMAAMSGRCVADCLAGQQQATLALQVRAVGFGSAILFVTNLVLMAWAVAFLGGRLTLGTARRREAAWALTPHGRHAEIRLLLAAGLAGSAVVHLSVLPEHLREWAAAGVFFGLLAVAELATAGLVLLRAHRVTWLAAAAVSVAPLSVWLWSRTAGLPFGPGVGAREAIGLADAAAGALEVLTLVLAVVCLRPRRAGRALLGPFRAQLALLAVVAVTAAGLGSGLAVFGELDGAVHEASQSTR
ncbi:MAG TPA: hypothetical protein VFJ97_02750 [Dermatophilaceae bacterium]|nr:hypothetical protein [Dermatophilaceae bacterium]